MPSSYLILPGLGNSGPEHWQSRWEALLPGTRRVAQADWDRPDLPGWLAGLEAAVARHGPDAILVAHSLACLLVAHWSQSSALAVRAALLVAPPDPDAPGFPPALLGFGPVPRARLRFPSSLVASADDPYARLAFSRGCAAAWGSGFVDIGAAGHINAASGLGDWPRGRAILQELVAITTISREGSRSDE